MLIGSAFGAIEIEKVTFTGGLRFDDQGRMYRTIDPDAVDYAGDPSPSVDEAWRKMIDGEQLCNKLKAMLFNCLQDDIQGSTKHNTKVSELMGRNVLILELGHLKDNLWHN